MHESCPTYLNKLRSWNWWQIAKMEVNYTNVMLGFDSSLHLGGAVSLISQIMGGVAINSLLFWYVP